MGEWSLVPGAKITLSAGDRRLDYAWALKQMQSDGNFLFSLPSDYIPEPRERYDVVVYFCSKPNPNLTLT